MPAPGADTTMRGKKGRACRSSLLLAALPLVLSACTPSHEELLARDRRDCAGFGFLPDSASYAECLLQLDAARQMGAYHHAHGHGL
jgi:hypothetical protein